MYSSRADDDACILIQIFSGPMLDADFERAHTEGERMDAAAAARGAAAVLIIELGPNAPVPPARWRKHFADAMSASRAPSLYLANVTQSALIRGALTAIDWMLRPRPGVHRFTCSSIEQACAWVRATSGQPYPELEALHAGARARVEPRG